MRGEAVILAGLVAAAVPARAADVFTPPSPSSPTNEAPMTPAVWPGFEIKQTKTLAALAWGGLPTPSPSLVANTTAACTEPPIVAVAADPAPPRTRYLPIIRAAECRHHLPRGLLASLIGAESAYKVGARSRVGAVGLTQLMPQTAIEMGVTDRFDPTGSIEGGARYLGQEVSRTTPRPLPMSRE